MDARIREKIRMFPDAPGVYLFKNAVGTVLYVGKALSLKKRVTSYFGAQAARNPKTHALMARVASAEYVLADNEHQAFLLENNLIKRHQPRYNILLRDDKTYPYLQLTAAEGFPRIQVTRRPKPDGSLYYGPYPNLRLREVFSLLRRHFGICDCKEPQDGKSKRACLRYQLKQCPGPCIGAVSKEDYARNVGRVRMFLEGKHDPLTALVREEMKRASDIREYEEAARLRDLLSSIASMQRDYVVVTPQAVDADAVALAAGMGKVVAVVLQMRQGKVTGTLNRTVENELEEPLPEVLPRFLEQYYVPGVFLPGEVLVQRGMNVPVSWTDWTGERRPGGFKAHAPVRGWRLSLMKLAVKNAMEAVREEANRAALLGVLQKALGLTRLPRTIAGFDVSTIQGVPSVGSAVFFKDGLPANHLYRKFKIRTVAKTDDYASLREMMKRYLGLLEREGNPPPDLFLVDGGRGQLAAVQPVLTHWLEAGHGVVALAKREEEIFVPGRAKPVDLTGREKVLHLLMRVRDEAHRFAVGYHRVVRDRQAVHSVLEEVKGLGKSKIETLIRRFGSVDTMRKAGIDDLEEVPGISRELAGRILKVIHVLNK